RAPAQIHPRAPFALLVVRADVVGVALNLQHNFGNGFGVVANYTYSDSKTDGDYSLPYNSRNAYNISPYYEQGKWSARVNLGWRS
ncbi:hypothetical protein, partial [Xanthomonas arboricola]|uniref:hypothetical protein n=1 Tax=Xanthomonas arboricola TaxID=56448 RepID=UPI003D18AF1B